MDETPANSTISGEGSAEDQILALIMRCRPGHDSSVEMIGFTHDTVKTAVKSMKATADTCRVTLRANYNTAIAIVKASA
jgi:hypothetical protein